jgi:octaprenyl-diphosphate synthase
MLIPDSRIEMGQHNHSIARPEPETAERASGNDLGKAHACISLELVQVETVLQQRLKRICREDQVLGRVLYDFSSTPGKMLRPRLVLLVAFAQRRDNLRDPRFASVYRSLIELACVVELVHCASLMHDDVLDAALTRRGRESVNAMFGDKAAILAGDLLYSQAFEILLGNFDREIGMMLTQCVHQMCSAEINHLFEHDFETYKRIIEQKTASLMMFCCQVSVQTVQRYGDAHGTAIGFGHFGYHFGMMYQLADDLSDLDNEHTLINRTGSVELFLHHTQCAEAFLERLPHSIYREGLQALVSYVTKKTGNLTGNPYGRNDSGSRPVNAKKKG